MKRAIPLISEWWWSLLLLRTEILKCRGDDGGAPWSQWSEFELLNSMLLLAAEKPERSQMKPELVNFINKTYFMASLLQSQDRHRHDLHLDVRKEKRGKDVGHKGSPKQEMDSRKGRRNLSYMLMRSLIPSFPATLGWIQVPRLSVGYRFTTCRARSSCPGLFTTFSGTGLSGFCNVHASTTKRSMSTLKLISSSWL